MQWSHDDPVTGERLQALAEVTVLTPSILAYHTSLRHAGVRNVCLLRGSHSELQVDTHALSALRGRRSIFVYTHLLSSFVDTVLPRLDHCFVLITHNSDHGVDARLARLADDPRIIHWFAQNVSTVHPKLTALPIGVANAQWPHGNLGALIGAAATAPSVRRDVVYVNFDVRTNPAVRVPLLERLRRLPEAWCAPVRPFREYLADMAGCRWVVSPAGNGVDCHRTWEALYLGAIPIVTRSPHGAMLHDGLPIIQLPDAGDFSREQLAEAECAPAFNRTNWQRLRLSYWRERIASLTRGPGAGR